MMKPWEQASGRLFLKEVMMTVPMTLAGKYFTSEAIFAEEKRHIFYERWIYVARETELAQPGSYKLLDFLGYNIILLRDYGGTVRAFHNVCRHRGTRLCEAGQGKLAKTIQCPYHAWTWDLHGRLIGVPSLDRMKHFNKADYSLHAVAVASWNGALFINLAANPESLATVLGGITHAFDAWNLGALQIARRIEYDVGANWKIIAQNFSECYHCPGVHPELTPISHYQSGETVYSEGICLGGYMEILQQGISWNGQLSASPMGSVAGAELERIHFYVLFPNLLLTLSPDYAVFYRLWPLAPDRTWLTCDFLFEPEAMAAPDFDVDNVAGFWDVINRQDWHVCELSQKGMQSPAYTPGPYYEWQEVGLIGIDREVLQALGHGENGRYHNDVIAS